MSSSAPAKPIASKTNSKMAAPKHKPAAVAPPNKDGGKASKMHKRSRSGKLWPVSGLRILQANPSFRLFHVPPAKEEV